MATFLQEEHSSQLIFVLRRQLVGSKLCKMEAALEDKQSVPQIDVLEKGIRLFCSPIVQLKSISLFESMLSVLISLSIMPWYEK